jgi:hypothetical protein
MNTVRDIEIICRGGNDWCSEIYVHGGKYENIHGGGYECVIDGARAARDDRDSTENQNSA